MSNIGPLTATEMTKIREAMGRLGERRACKRLGISRQTFGRALAGLDIQAGTRALIKANLAKLKP